jgi:hypothetical protein
MKNVNLKVLVFQAIKNGEAFKHSHPGGKRGDF